VPPQPPLQPPDLWSTLIQMAQDQQGLIAAASGSTFAALCGLTALFMCLTRHRRRRGHRPPLLVRRATRSQAAKTAVVSSACSKGLPSEVCVSSLGDRMSIASVDEPQSVAPSAGTRTRNYPSIDPSEVNVELALSTAPPSASQSLPVASAAAPSAPVPSFAPASTPTSALDVSQRDNLSSVISSSTRRAHALPSSRGGGKLTPPQTGAKKVAERARVVSSADLD